LIDGVPTFRADGAQLGDGNGDVVYEFFLYRSGRRNLLGAKIETITSLSDPTKTENQTTSVLEETIEIPK